MAFLSLTQGIINGLAFSQDSMWPHIRLLIDGLNPYEIYLYNPEMFDNLGFSDYFGRGVHYPPSVLYLMSPLAVVSDPTQSKMLLLIVSVLSSIVILVVFKKMYFSKSSSREFVILSLLFFAGLPFRNTLGVGQNGLIALAFLMLALLFIDKKILSGFFLTFALIKYTLTAPFILYFLYKKKYTVVLIAGAVHLVLNLYGAHTLGMNLIDLALLVLETSTSLSDSGYIDLMSINSNLTIRIFLYFLVTLIIGYSIVKDKLSIALISLLSLIIVYHRIYDYFILILLYPILNSKLLKSSYYYILIHFFIIVRIFEWFMVDLKLQQIFGLVPIVIFTILELKSDLIEKIDK
jgi:hypothetical protein